LEEVCEEGLCVKLDIMVVKSKNKNENWEKLVSSLKKGIAEMEKERKAGKQEQLNAVEVICSHEDIERTRRG
jgi:hypothetical protein